MCYYLGFINMIDNLLKKGRRLSVGIISFAELPPRCGTDERVYELAKALAENDMKVHLFINIHNVQSTEKIKNLQLINFNATRLNLVKMILTRLFLVPLYGRFDILQIELYRIRFANTLLRFSKLIAKKTSIIIHDARAGVKKDSDSSFVTPVLNMANVLIFVDKNLIKNYSNIYGEWVKDKAVIIRNSARLPDKLYDRSMLRKTMKISEYETIAVFTGPANFPPNKSAIDEIYRLVEQYADSLQQRKIRFLLAGFQTEKLPENPLILKLGLVEDIFEILSLADIGLAPMPDSFTGSHIKTLYYMAAELPVISSPDGVKGLEGIKSGLNVLLYTDLKNFHDKLVNLCIDKTLAKRLGYNAKQMIINNYTWDKVATQLISAYLTLSNFTLKKKDPS